MSTDVKTSVRRFTPKCAVDVEVYGAPERRRKYAKFAIVPHLLQIGYIEKGNGWEVVSVEIHGHRVTKDGLGASSRDSIWVADLPNEEQWVKDAIRDNCPRVSLR
jgi:hypothetical protein